MLLVRIFDKNFIHSPSVSTQPGSKHCSSILGWIRKGGPTPVTIYTDEFLYNRPRGPLRLRIMWVWAKILRAIKWNNHLRIAWLIEPQAINPMIYEHIQLANDFDYIFSHDKLLLSKCKLPSHYIPYTGCWIDKEDYGIHPKSRLISIVASNKTQTIGHKLRHEIIKRYGPQFDAILGRGYKAFENKADSLKEYCFQIVVENSRTPGYFTEKIIDCFMCGTIPIYWGCPEIGDIFDTDGIIAFDSLDKLEDILSMLSFDLYFSKIQAIHHNFQIANDHYLLEEDLMHHALLSSLENNHTVVP